MKSIEKIIEDIKKNVLKVFGPLIKKKEDAEDVDDESEADANAQGEENDKAEEADEKADEKEEKNKELEAKNKRSKIIKIVLVVGLIYLGFDEYYNPTPTEEESKKKTEENKAGKTKKKDENIKNISEASHEKSAEESTQIKTGATESTYENSTALSENPEGPMVSNNEPISGDLTTSEMTQASSLETTSLADSSASAVSQTTTTEPEAKVETPVMENKSETNSISPASIETNTAMDSSFNQEESSLEQAVTNLSQEVKTEESTKQEKPIPDYEQLGRGLVYNCKEKFWACVDKKTYFNCRENASWNERNNGPKECSVVNVYASEKDCRVVQIYNINNKITPDFCN